MWPGPLKGLSLDQSNGVGSLFFLNAYILHAFASYYMRTKRNETKRELNENIRKRTHVLCEGERIWIENKARQDGAR